MNKPKLIYFDASVSRGEECRLALHLAGIDFEDVRIKGADWPAMKAQTPYGALPVLELPGKPPLAHSNAILVLIGRRHGLHPYDDFEAARHEGVMLYVEDLRAAMAPTVDMAGAEKQAAREALAADYLPAWGAAVEKNIASGRSSAGRRSRLRTSRSTWRCAGSAAARSTTCPPRSSLATPGSWGCTTPCATTRA